MTSLLHYDKLSTRFCFQVTEPVIFVWSRKLMKRFGCPTLVGWTAGLLSHDQMDFFFAMAKFSQWS